MSGSTKHLCVVGWRAKNNERQHALTAPQRLLEAGEQRVDPDRPRSGARKNTHTHTQSVGRLRQGMKGRNCCPQHTRQRATPKNNKKINRQGRSFPFAPTATTKNKNRNRHDHDHQKQHPREGGGGFQVNRARPKISRKAGAGARRLPRASSERVQYTCKPKNYKVAQFGRLHIYFPSHLVNGTRGGGRLTACM